jgi:Fe-S cluster biogenesis protein NfuA
MDSISISLEFTPNPNTLKFVVNRSLIEKGAANFPTAQHGDKSPLARKLFAVPGVQAVMIGTTFVTITKSTSGDWDVLAEEVPKTLEAHLKSGEPILDPSFSFGSDAQSDTPLTEIEKKIREVLDNDIRPAVAMDGGDITFGKYEDGIVYLHLQGSCSSCPSSVATLKMGVENRLKEVIPEIKEVVQV